MSPSAGGALLEHDWLEAEAGARRVAGDPLWHALTERRRQVLTEIALMAGATGLAGFTEMWKAVRAGDYGRAADEIVLSTLKPPARVGRLQAAMLEG